MRVAAQREIEAPKSGAIVAPTKLRALIFDVDGTMYDQALLRRLMFLRLAKAYAVRPWKGWRVARVLQAYRRAQELMRSREEIGSDIAAEQIRLACAATGCDMDFVRQIVRRWIEQEPLGVLERCRWPELIDVLEWARRDEIRLAVLSDYAAETKLRALGVAEYFEIVLSAQSAEVRRLKPHPAGLEKVAAMMGLRAEEAAYVGDRDDVDRVCALGAGMHYIATSRKAWQTRSGSTDVVRSLVALASRMNKDQGVINE